ELASPPPAVSTISSSSFSICLISSLTALSWAEMPLSYSLSRIIRSIFSSTSDITFSLSVWLPAGGGKYSYYRPVGEVLRVRRFPGEEGASECGQRPAGSPTVTAFSQLDTPLPRIMVDHSVSLSLLAILL